MEKKLTFPKVLSASAEYIYENLSEEQFANILNNQVYSPYLHREILRIIDESVELELYEYAEICHKWLNQ